MQEGGTQQHVHRSLELLTRLAMSALEEEQAWSSWKVCTHECTTETSSLQAAFSVTVDPLHLDITDHTHSESGHYTLVQVKSSQGWQHSQMRTEECSSAQPAPVKSMEHSVIISVNNQLSTVHCDPKVKTCMRAVARGGAIFRTLLIRNGMQLPAPFVPLLRSCFFIHDRSTRPSTATIIHYI